ncbi:MULTISPECIES: hypothetical protein [unclassified Kitasatospora]|uniref:hypothetical protein n=1 Tax=unclassified Kitasatospora TaxID=2633591 RepID=UPI0024734A63|nr:hypothetical protein [Kitasatospora sp. MAP12-44]
MATLAAIAVVAGLCTVVPASADTGNYYGNGSLTAMSTGTVGTGIGAQLTGDMMVQRARDWVSHQVIYNQGKSFADAEVGGPYRTDDGGLVDMAWQLPSSPAVTTPSPGIDSAPYSTKLTSWSQLQPGDALAVAGKHISLFAGWTNQANGDFTYIAEENSSVPTAEYPANIHDPSIDGYPASAYELLRYTNPLPAIPADFNVTLSGFNPGQTVSGTVHLTSTPTQSDVIGGLNYVISGPNGYYSEVPAGRGANYPYALNTTQLANGSYTVSMIASETDGQNHTYGGGSFIVSNTTAPGPGYNAVLAKNSIGLYNWTQESNPGIKAIATNGGVQLMLDNSGVVWAKSSIGPYNWTQESDPVVQAIAVGSDGTQMILDNNGTVLAKNSIGLYNWTQESGPGIKAIATNGGVQLMLDNSGVVWAKSSIGLYNWTQESDPVVQAIAVGSDGTQMILDNKGTVLAKNSIGLYNWTQESDPVVTAIAVGSDGTQMILDNKGTVLAKNSIGLYNWTQESDPGIKAIATNSGVQLILDNNGTVFAKSSIGLYNWTQESDPVVTAIAVGSDGTQMILSQ